MQDARSPSIAQEDELPRSRRRRSLAAYFSSADGARAIYFIAGAIAIGVIFWLLQFATDGICCGDLDGYYHIGWSRMLWEGMRSGGPFPPPFTWLPLTTLSPEKYVDHHFLFHVLQIPFTWFGDMRVGAKISAWLFASLALISCYWLVIRYRLSYTLVWLVALLACSTAFLYRIQMTKAPSISLVFMVTGIYLLFERRYRWLAPLAFLYVWTYSLWVMLGVAAVIWAAIILWSERRIEWRPVVWTGIGSLAGLIINPYFPANIRLFVEHVAMKLNAGEFAVSVGGEWYPYSSWEFLANCFIAFVATFAGLMAFRAYDKKAAERPLFFLAFSTVLLLMNTAQRRWVEYWPPFAVLFAAFALQMAFDRARDAARLPDEVLDDLRPYLDEGGPPTTIEEKLKRIWDEGEAALIGLLLCVMAFAAFARFGDGVNLSAPQLDANLIVRAIIAALIFGGGVTLYFKWRGLRQAGVAVVTFALGATLLVSVNRAYADIAASPPYEQYREGIVWLRANVPPGERVFNTDWDDFPKLFYFDPTHNYISGLDPTYLLNEHPELAELYERITLGRERDPAPLIRDRFGARYVFSDTERVHDSFYYNAIQSGWFEEVFRDDACVVLRLRDQRQTPPVEPTPDDADDTDDGPPDTDVEP